jgi:site-specific DNA-cytosine methylase
MEAGCLARAPVWTDLRTFDGKPWRGVVDILTAGYPCQPFSCAGKRGGSSDPRHLWPEVRRVIGECQPPIVFLENVPGHLSLGFEQVANELQELGYDIAASLFAASEVGATHKRERLFIVGLANASRGGRTLPNDAEIRGASAYVEGKKTQLDLANASQRWSTPKASDAYKGGPNMRGSKGDMPLPSQSAQWRTPTARDYKDGPTTTLGRQVVRTHTHTHTHSRQGRSMTGETCRKNSGRRLNPVFVSWLMGWPLLEPTISDCSATEWSHYRQRMRSALCGLLSDFEASDDDDLPLFRQAS